MGTTILDLLNAISDEKLCDRTIQDGLFTDKRPPDATAKYYDYINAISDEELYDRMIQYGLFTDRLPPVFDGSSFLAYCKTSPCFNPKTPYDYVRYDSMRNINIPRPLGIPTPIAHERLCRCLKQEWSQLQEYFQKTTSNQSHIVSRIHIRKIKDTDALFQMNYDNWKYDGTPEPDLMIGKHYVVSADISTCFPSIYTHAISWALAGKSTAKDNKNNKEKGYNQIDYFVRNSQNGETHGILIGPHTSNILSEIILCKIDQTLCNEEKHKPWDYVRHIDDFSCYVKNREEASQFLLELNTCLKEYGLSLNHKKTKIEELPATTTEPWVRKLQRQILLFEKFHAYVDYHEVRVFVDFCVDLMKENKDNASILKYGLKALKNYTMTPNAQQYLTKISVSLALIYPYIVPILDQYIFIPCQTELNQPRQLKNYVNMIYNHYFKNNYFEACSFALYYAIKYDFEISDFNAQQVIKKDDCILDLMALIYSRKRKNKEDQQTLREEAKILCSQGDFDIFWPFTYECLSWEEFDLENQKDMDKKKDQEDVDKKEDQEDADKKKDRKNMDKKEDWTHMKKEKVSFLKPEYR